MQVDDHDHACLDRGAEQRDVANSYGHAEVVAQQLLQDEAAGECIECRENQPSRFRNGMKRHVKERKDKEKYDRQYDLQGFFGP